MLPKVKIQPHKTMKQTFNKLQKYLFYKKKQNTLKT